MSQTRSSKTNRNVLLLLAAALLFFAGLAVGNWLMTDATFKGLIAEVRRATLEDDTGKVVTITVALVAAIYLFSYLLTLEGRRHANRWVDSLNTAQRGSQLSMHKDIDAVMGNRLREQHADIRGRAEHHFEVFTDFLCWHYMAIGTFSVCALVAAITLFFITQKGWADAGTQDSRLVTVFVVTTAAAVYYKSFISVYRQTENIADNKQLYLNYVALENDLRTFCAVGAYSIGEDKKGAADFISHVDKKLNEFNNISVGFDATKVPTYEGLLDGIKKPAPASEQAVTPTPVSNNGGQPRKHDPQPPGGQDADKQKESVNLAAWDNLHPERGGIYVVQKGDTLEGISQMAYQDPQQWNRIMKANEDIEDKNYIQAGWQLVIPPADASGQNGNEE